MEQKQNVFEVAKDKRSKLYERQWHELERRIKKETETLKMQAHALEQAAEFRAERLKAKLAKMERNLKANFG